MSDEKIVVYRLIPQDADGGINISAEQVLKAHYEHALTHDGRVVFTATSSKLYEKAEQIILLLPHSDVALKTDIHSSGKFSNDTFDSQFSVPEKFQQETLEDEIAKGVAWYQLENTQLLIRKELKNQYIVENNGNDISDYKGNSPFYAIHR